jgi:hydroxymethylpyrimidine pyrophosphatase-like HAD family hydrolase
MGSDSPVGLSLGLAVDLDGTALSPRRRIEECDKRALSRATDAGMTLIFLSARPLWSVRELTNGVRTAFLIASGGAVLADGEGRVLSRAEMDVDTLTWMSRKLTAMRVAALIYRDEETVASRILWKSAFE